MDNATQEFMIGDRVRYVGLTVMTVPRAAEGMVTHVEDTPAGALYWATFPGYDDLECFAAELELVDRPTSPVAAACCIVCGQVFDGGA